MCLNDSWTSTSFLRLFEAITYDLLSVSGKCAHSLLYTYSYFNLWHYFSLPPDSVLSSASNAHHPSVIFIIALMLSSVSIK